MGVLGQGGAMTKVPVPESAPDGLKDDGWLLWDADPPEGKDPKQPHWRGDYQISYTDPGDWHTFAESVEASKEKDSWGIGYVNGVGNDDAPDNRLGTIDIDGGLIDGGRLKEWVPSLAAFIDAGAYMSISASGTGLHIPVIGCERPEWWKDCSFPDQGHEGVEYLTKKFTAYTGQRYHLSGEHVTTTDPTPFLREAFGVIRGETPETTETNAKPARSPTDETESVEVGQADEWLSAPTIGEMLDEIDPDIPHQRWRNVGYAIHSVLPGSEGKRLFVEWSQRGDKWNDRAERSADWIWSEATENGGVTPATLVYEAKQHGWAGSPVTADGGAVQALSVDHIPGAELVAGVNFDPPRRSNGQPEISPNLVNRVLSILWERGEAKTGEIQLALGGHRKKRQIRRVMAYLVEKEVAERLGSGPATRYAHRFK